MPGSIKASTRKIYQSMNNRWLRRYIPIRIVFIEITTACNLSCVGCYHNVKEYPSKNKYMSLEDFKLYIDQLPSIFLLFMTGVGEPTLHPLLPKMLKYAKDSQKISAITITINALAQKPEIFKKLFICGLTNLTISVDSLDQREINQLRPGTDVKRLANNIKYILKENHDKDIGVNTVISTVNLHTFDKTVKTLVDLGVKSVNFYPYDDYGGAGLSNFSISPEQKREFLNKMNNLRISSITLKQTGFKPTNTPCSLPYNAPFITVDGYLTPCCRTFDKDIFAYGNLKQHYFKKLFYSKRYDAHQQNINKGIYPNFCRGCVENHREFNSLS